MPIMVAKLSARPPIPTTQGFMTIILYVKPVMTICLAVRPMMPTPRPVCRKVLLRYSLSNTGIPPSSLVSRLKTRLIATKVPPKIAPPTSNLLVFDPPVMVLAGDDWLYARRAPGAIMLLRMAVRTGAELIREVKNPEFFKGDEV